METKMITIPFDLERAKRISEGLEEGKITTKGADKVRIICWDFNNLHYQIIALVNSTCTENCFQYTSSGNPFLDNRESIFDLVLQVPEYTQYKDGDILIEEGDECPFIYKGYLENDKSMADYYTGINIHNNLVLSKRGGWCELKEIGGYANEEQKQKLINALQDSSNPLAKEYLKRFFGIEKEEFQPFDKVLVRNKGEIWKAAFFSFLYKRKEDYYYCTTGEVFYEECIPYNEDTKHLIGTNKPYKVNTK